MVKISLVNDQTLSTCLPLSDEPLSDELLPLSDEPLSDEPLSAGVAPPPHAANSMLAIINKLKIDKIDLRMFLLLLIILMSYTNFCMENLHTVGQGFLLHK